ncbi:MAG TPA: ABC transporter permease, partial [Verrucomicrobiota bacterium]|nr:ABC transporter permease [Verrucomicrobiota bacterium]
MKPPANPPCCRAALVTAGPALAWLLVFLALPLLAVAVVSFTTRGEYGDFGPPFTWENYARLAGWTELGFDPLYPRILGRSLALGAATTALCALLAAPLAFYIAGLPR